MPIKPEFRHLYSGPAWKVARDAVRVRDGNRCRHCNHRNGAWVVLEKGRRVEITARDAAAAKLRGLKVVRIVCGACHVYRVPPMSYDVKYLLWLCSGCHLSFDRRSHRIHSASKKDLARPLLAAAS